MFRVFQILIKIVSQYYSKRGGRGGREIYKSSKDFMKTNTPNKRLHNLSIPQLSVIIFQCLYLFGLWLMKLTPNVWPVGLGV